VPVEKVGLSVLREARERHKTLTFENLSQQVGKVPPKKLALAMAVLVAKGLVKQILRVESPDGGGIGDFESIEQIPEHMHDWQTDTILHVQPENIVVLYRF
jgi:DNA-binding HxlR family transcriptional regulator